MLIFFFEFILKHFEIYYSEREWPLHEGYHVLHVFKRLRIANRPFYTCKVFFLIYTYHLVKN